MNKYSRFHQTWKLYPKLPMKCVSVLPDEGFGVRIVPLTDDGHQFYVWCKPKPNKGYARHRVFAICACGRNIPFGRMGQHRMACEPLQEATRI